MSKLLFVYERDMPTISITREMFAGLKDYPEIESDFKYLTDVTTQDIDNHDIIIFMRPEDVYSCAIARRARQAGHLVVTFCDDDLLNLPKSIPSIPWRKKGLRSTLSFSDVIWSSSKYLSDKYKDLTSGKRVVVGDTIVQPEELSEYKDKPEVNEVRIVYAAGLSHASLFEKYIGPIIPKLKEDFGDSISFTFVSVHPQVDGVRCEYVSGMPLLEYRRYMKEQQFDIGVAPLPNDDFSKCKYFNKFLEYRTYAVFIQIHLRIVM